MADKYSYAIAKTKHYVNGNSGANQIYKAEFYVLATRDGSDIIGTSYEKVRLPDTEGSFIAFNDVKMENIVDWCKAALGADKLKELEAYASANLQGLIEQKKNESEWSSLKGEKFWNQ